jgi:hypothetical protein
LMMPEDMNSINAMMQKTSEKFKGRKRMVVSSTPNGRRDMFYVHCHKKNVKEFWLPSFVNPHFTPDDEQEQRELSTETGFIHEIVADWGQQSAGVFKPSVLEVVANEEDDYSYLPIRPKGCGPIVLGADWDKYGAGVNIVLVGNVNGKLKLIYREEVDRSQHEYTLGAAVERIIELDRIFLVNYLYVDKGYGEFQWEELVKRLPAGEERVKGKNFSSSVLETDPVTGMTTKEEFKPFMVENAVNLYERKMVLFPHSDTRFIEQITGYIQTRISATGRPVFASMDPEGIGDHALDAWMMALLGHTEQYGDLIIPFESIPPRTIQSNLALAPGDSEREREEMSLNFLRSRRPMTTTDRRRSSQVFNRPGF